METKRFTVVDTRSNAVRTFNSEATTVAELKRDLRNIGINPDGMSIQEGLTKTELVGDETALPSNVSYRGTVTNNLVFRLTQPDKKIKSGNDCCSRAEIYSKVKDLSLADVIKAKYGNNYTNVKTADLVKEVTEAMKDLTAHKSCDNPVKDAIATLTSILVKEGFLSSRQGNQVLEPLLGVKIFDEDPFGEQDDQMPFNYDIEELFEGM